MKGLEQLSLDEEKILSEDKSEVRVIPVGVPTVLRWKNYQSLTAQIKKNAPQSANAYVLGRSAEVIRGIEDTAVQYYRILE